MKLLFVIYDFYPNVGATANCVMNLCQYFLLKGISVQVLCFKQSTNELNEENYKGIIIHRILNTLHLTKHSIIIDFMNKPCRSVLWIIEKFLNKFFNSSNEINQTSIRYFKKRIVELHRRYHYDYVIAVSASMEPAIAIMDIKNNLNRIGFYQVDPYTSNAILDRNKQNIRFQLEKKIYDEFDFIVTTPIIYEENIKTMLWKSRVRPCEFPNILERDRNAKSVLEGEGISCVFAGYLLKQVRDPSYLFRIIEEINNTGVNINFHFFCFGDLSDIVKLCKRCTNVYLHNKQSNEKIFDYIHAADILINIGNNMLNQVPSKIFDYISTGKPIVNFFKSEQCPSLKYFMHYPIVLNINESLSSETTLRMFIDFCRQNCGKEIAFQKISELYKENTVAYVGDNFIDLMGGEKW